MHESGSEPGSHTIAACRTENGNHSENESGLRGSHTPPAEAPRVSHFLPHCLALRSLFLITKLFRNRAAWLARATLYQKKSAMIHSSLIHLQITVSTVFTANTPRQMFWSVLAGEWWLHRHRPCCLFFESFSKSVHWLVFKRCRRQSNCQQCFQRLFNGTLKHATSTATDAMQLGQEDFLSAPLALLRHSVLCLCYKESAGLWGVGVCAERGGVSRAPAGRRDQLYIVGFVYARIIWLSEVRSHCHGTSCCCCCCCRAAYFFLFSFFIAELRETFQWRLSGLSHTLIFLSGLK